MKTWLILSAGNEAMDYGEHWATVEGETAEEAVSSYFGRSAAWTRDTKVLAIPYPPDGMKRIGTDATFVEVER